MSNLKRRLLLGLEKQALNVITGSLSGSGTLPIPVGVVNVTLTGRGGTGGDNSYYNPGQPYIAPSGWVAGSTGQWRGVGGTAGGVTWTDPGPPYSDPLNLPAITANGQIATSGPWSTRIADSGGNPAWQLNCMSTWQSEYYIAGYYTDPGQTYSAPSSGGGVYAGGNTTATLNGVTDTWPGGSGGIASSSTQTLSSTGAGQTLTYSVASGGTLSYSYQI